MPNADVAMYSIVAPKIEKGSLGMLIDCSIIKAPKTVRSRKLLTRTIDPETINLRRPRTSIVIHATVIIRR